MSLPQNTRILFIGNIAQNSYLLAKFLRRRGFAADLLIYSYTHLMGQPEWEDAEISGNPPHWDAQWARYVRGGFRRPEWVMEIRQPPPPSRWVRLCGRFRRKRLVGDARPKGDQWEG